MCRLNGPRSGTRRPLCGGALYLGASTTLVNCTFARNQCGDDDGGGGVYFSASGTSLSIRNCILWGNMTDAASLPDAEADQIKIAAGTATATWTCIQFLDGLAGEGNVDDDPLFENASLGQLRSQSGGLRVRILHFERH